MKPAATDIGFVLVVPSATNEPESAGYSLL
jgi:hypothetical protein